MYLSNKHNKKDFDKYFNLLNELFYKIDMIENDRITTHIIDIFKDNLMKGLIK